MQIHEILDSVIEPLTFFYFCSFFFIKPGNLNCLILEILPSQLRLRLKEHSLIFKNI